MKSRLALMLLAAFLPACGSSTPPDGPVPPTGQYYGAASAINPAQKLMVVQAGRVSSATVRVTSSTRFSGVSGFEEMVGDYAAGYKMDVTVTTDSANAVESNALEIAVQSKTGPFAVHFVQPASLNTWIGLLAFPQPPGDPRGAILILPWTQMRSDSELRSPDDIRRALTAGELVCIAGDGFGMSVATTEAMTIGAWHYTGDTARPCDGK